MRFYGLALLASAAVVACGGGEKASDTTKAAAPSTPATTSAPAAGAPAAGGVAPMPATGATVQVQMYGDTQHGYKFVPSDIKVKQGGAVKFTVVNGQPHNITFDPAAITDAQTKAQLNANMIGEISELSSPMLLNAGDSYTISFAGIKPGTYAIHCTPHQALGMNGTITVQ